MPISYPFAMLITDQESVFRMVPCIEDLFSFFLLDNLSNLFDAPFSLMNIIESSILLSVGENLGLSSLV